MNNNELKDLILRQLAKLQKSLMLSHILAEYNIELEMNKFDIILNELNHAGLIYRQYKHQDFQIGLLPAGEEFVLQNSFSEPNKPVIDLE